MLRVCRGFAPNFVRLPPRELHAPTQQPTLRIIVSYAPGAQSNGRANNSYAFIGCKFIGLLLMGNVWAILYQVLYTIFT